MSNSETHCDCAGPVGPAGEHEPHCKLYAEGKCECGRDLVLCENGERHCGDTLDNFKVRHGYAYGSAS